MKYEEIPFEVRRALYLFASGGYFLIDFSDPDGEEFGSFVRPYMPYQFFRDRMGQVWEILKDLKSEEVKALFIEAQKEFKDYTW